MLKALYDYALQRGLTVPDGCVKKTVKAYVCLSSTNPNYAEVIPGADEAVVCPDIGSLANGTDKSNVLCEKRSVVFAESDNAKSRFFWNAMASCAKRDVLLERCMRATGDVQLHERIQAELDRYKVKPADRISFMVDSESILVRYDVLAWWQEFRRQFQKSGGQRVPCLITGELIEPMATTPPVSGLGIVGGHARGDALICFDKNAFCSYNLKQAANAPVSESAMAAVKAALDDLIRHAPVLAGMKFVHWYDRELPDELDPLLSQEFGFSFAGEDADEEEELSPEEQLQQARAAEYSADKLVKSVWGSEIQKLPPNASSHILLLNGVGGRVMLRRYMRGSYEELRDNLDAWHRDLALTNASGTGNLAPCKLTARLIRLLSYQKADSKPLNRLDKELSGQMMSILAAILTNGPLPDAVAARALTHLRSELLAEDDGDRSAMRLYSMGLVCQWLKVWLLRRRNVVVQEGSIMEGYNPDFKNTAYHCGGMMAIFSRIQETAVPEMGAGVLQRYYASAIQSPQMVLGTLSKQSTHHLEKLDSRGLARYFSDKLAEQSLRIGTEIPATLTLAEQSCFALGYYQMLAQLNMERNVARAQRMAKNEKDMEE